jgi:hypothetical protein
VVGAVVGVEVVGEVVGAVVGDEVVGATVGEVVGDDVVGEAVGAVVGVEVVGEEVGAVVGDEVVGAAVGEVVGDDVVGEAVGAVVGVEVVGEAVGAVVGVEVVGEVVGLVVGDTVVGRKRSALAISWSPSVDAFQPLDSNSVLIGQKFRATTTVLVLTADGVWNATSGWPDPQLATFVALATRAAVGLHHPPWEPPRVPPLKDATPSRRGWPAMLGTRAPLHP